MAGNEANFIIRLRDKISGPAKKASMALGLFGQKARDADGRFKKMTFGDKMKAQAMKVVKYAAVAGAAMAGLVGRDIIMTGAGFAEAISAVGAVGLQTRDQIAALEEKAKDLGRTTKFTATEAANAMEVMARAGFKQTEILSGVDGVLSAAAASGLEIAEVANHVSNALKGMGLAADQSGRVADVLSLASSRTNSSIGSLGESLKNVASTARTLNVPLEDTVAAVALLQDVGLDASVAGSAMNVMLTKMAKPTADIAAKMDRFGVSFKDAEGNMLPFQEVLANISSAAAQSGGNMDRVAFLADLVGLRGQKAASNLSDLFDSGKVKALTKELYGAAGSAEKMAKLRMDNLAGDWTLFLSAVDGVKIALFETQNGPLRGIVQRLTEWVGANAELIQSGFVRFVQFLTTSLPAILKSVVGVAAGLGDVMAALTGADDGVGSLEKIAFALQIGADYLEVYGDEIAVAARWLGIFAGIAIVTIGAMKLFAIFGVAAGLVMKLVAAVKIAIAVIGAIAVALSAPVWAVAAIIAALVAGIAAFWYFWDEIKDWASTVWEGMTSSGYSIGQALIEGIAAGLNPAFLFSKITSMGADMVRHVARSFGVDMGVATDVVAGGAKAAQKSNTLGAGKTKVDAPSVPRKDFDFESLFSRRNTDANGNEKPGAIVNLKPTINFNGSGMSSGDQQAAASSMLSQLTNALEAAQ